MHWCTGASKYKSKGNIMFQFCNCLFVLLYQPYVAKVGHLGVAKVGQSYRLFQWRKCNPFTLATPCTVHFSQGSGSCRTISCLFRVVLLLGLLFE